MRFCESPYLCNIKILILLLSSSDSYCKCAGTRVLLYENRHRYCMLLPYLVPSERASARAAVARREGRCMAADVQAASNRRIETAASPCPPAAKHAPRTFAINGKQSRHQPLIQALPTYVSHVAAFWADNVIADICWCALDSQGCFCNYDSTRMARLSGAAGLPVDSFACLAARVCWAVSIT